MPPFRVRPPASCAGDRRLSWRKDCGVAGRPAAPWAGPLEGPVAGRRDDEPVPQIAVESGLAEALSKLLQVLREASSRETSIDEVTWSRRFVLRKPTVETIDMHQAPARRPEQGDARFQLLLPLTDLEQVKVAAEQRQHEDDLRKKRDEEEKRRRKAEAERAKAEAKRKQRAEAAAAEAAARLQMQKGKKGSKGATKGGAKGPQ
ncbi:unnamed protein product, partial [Prorocentrum cordatum]